MAESNENKINFIYVSHQIEEIVPAISHVAIILKDGKIIAQGLKERHSDRKKFNRFI